MDFILQRLEIFENRYASVSADFVAFNEALTERYDAENGALVLTDGSYKDFLEKYLANIAKGL